MVYVEQNGESNLWIPENKEEVLEGRVVEKREGMYGKQFVIKREKDGKEILTPCHRVLQNRMAHVVEGDKVKILYEGEEPPSVRGQNPMKVYRVWVDKPEEEEISG